VGGEGEGAHGAIYDLGFMNYDFSRPLVPAIEQHIINHKSEIINHPPGTPMTSPPRPEPTHVSGEVFVAAAGALLLHSLAASCLFGFLGFVAPLLDSVYVELGAKLNQTATGIFTITRLYEDYWLLVVLGAIAIDIV